MFNTEGKTKWMVYWVFKDLTVLTAGREAFYVKELEDWTEAYNACTLVINMAVNKNDKNTGTYWERQEKPKILVFELFLNEEIFEHCSSLGN